MALLKTTNTVAVHVVRLKFCLIFSFLGTTHEFKGLQGNREHSSFIKIVKLVRRCNEMQTIIIQTPIKPIINSPLPFPSAVFIKIKIIKNIIKTIRGTPHAKRKLLRYFLVKSL